MTIIIRNDAAKAARQPESQPKAVERPAAADTSRALGDSTGLEIGTHSPKLLDALQSIREMRSSILTGKVSDSRGAEAAGENRIREAGMADDAINLAKSQILNQTGSGTLTPLRQDAQSFLHLLK